MDMVTRFCDSVMVVSFGCQILFKDLRILIFNPFESKVLPKLVRWLTIYVNHFCMSQIFSPATFRTSCILESMSSSNHILRHQFLHGLLLRFPTFLSHQCSQICCKIHQGLKEMKLYFLPLHHIGLLGFHLQSTKQRVQLPEHY